MITHKSDNWLSPKVQIKKSPLQGKGMFANEIIEPNERVVEWGGVYLDKKEAEEARGKKEIVMQWDDDLFSAENRGEEDGYFINHSCKPNVWMNDAFTLVTNRRIEPGEELTADYAMWEADENYISKWECQCGSPDCRHKITGRDWRLPKLQDKYKNHFSPLINKRIKSDS